MSIIEMFIIEMFLTNEQFAFASCGLGVAPDRGIFGSC